MRSSPATSIIILYIVKVPAWPKGSRPGRQRRATTDRSMLSPRSAEFHDCVAEVQYVRLRSAGEEAPAPGLKPAECLRGGVAGLRFEKSAQTFDDLGRRLDP